MGLIDSEEEGFDQGWEIAAMDGNVDTMLVRRELGERERKKKKKKQLTKTQTFRSKTDLQSPS